MTAVLVERRGHVLLATLNRPEARNAVNLELAALLGEALDEADRDPEIRAFVVTGAGDKVLDEALALADRIAANAPLAVQASKRIALGISDGRVPAEEAAWSLNEAEMLAVLRSEDAAEGPRAFAEKRAPVWRAR